MTHHYEVNGMSCSHCEARVQKALLGNADITDVKINRESKEAVITMTHHVPTAILNELLGKAGGYTITEKA